MKTPNEAEELSRAMSNVGSLVLRHQRAACAGYELHRLVESGFRTITIRVYSRASRGGREDRLVTEVEARDVRGVAEVATGDDIFEALALCGKTLVCSVCGKARPADWFRITESRLRCKECNRERSESGRRNEKHA